MSRSSYHFQNVRETNASEEANSANRRRRSVAQRSRRESTRNATLASRATTSVAAEDEASVIPLANAPPTVRGLDPSMVQSLVSTVTAEVTRQLTATLPALASLSGPTSSVTGDVPPLAEERCLSTPPLPGVSATNLVEGAIAAAHSRIIGAPQLLPTSAQTQRQANPSQIFLSASLPIDSQLSAKIKEKIWNEEFVDFGSLLSNSVHDKYQISVQNTETGASACFCLEPVSRPKKIMSIEVWQQAFNIFVGVYTQKHPHEAPALMKYGQTIRDLAASGQNWRFYDQNFRFFRVRRQTVFLGVRSIRNFGCVLNSLLKRSRPIINQPVFQNWEGRQFLLDTVLNFIAVSFAQLLIALLNIPVLSAKRERTALVSVIFVPQRVNQTPILTVQPSLPTPVKLKPLVKFLSGYPPELVQYIIYGFSKGFRLHFQGRRQFFIPNNLPSALQNPKFVDKKLGQELAANRIVRSRPRHFSLFLFHLLA